MTKEKEWVSPTDKQEENLAKEILLAVHPIVSTIKDESEDENYESNDLKKILLAVKAGTDIRRKVCKDFRNQNPGKNCHTYYFDVMPIIASSIACCIIDGDINDCHPHSVLSSKINAFARAAIFLENCYHVDKEVELNDAGIDTAMLAIEMNEGEN